MRDALHKCHLKIILGVDSKQSTNSMKNPNLAILCIIALSPITLSADGPDESTTQEAFEFAFFVFDDFRITPQVGVVYEPVFLEHLGIPVRTEQKVGGTKDPTYRVNRETLYYEGLEITVSRGVDATPTSWTWLERVYITDPRYKLRHGLRVGAELKEFKERLGPWRPKSASGKPQISFYSGGHGDVGGVTHGAHATVRLDVDDEGLITAVEITYWAD